MNNLHLILFSAAQGHIIRSILISITKAVLNIFQSGNICLDEDIQAAQTL